MIPPEDQTRQSFQAALEKLLAVMDDATDPLGAYAIINRAGLLESAEVRSLMSVISSARPSTQQVIQTNDAATIARAVIPAVLMRYQRVAGSLRYDKPAVAGLADEFVAALCEAETPVVLTAPLFHLSCELDNVNLGSTTWVERLTLQERERLVQSEGGELPDPATLQVTHAVRVRARFGGQWDMPDLKQEAQQVASVLRLLQASTTTVSLAWLEAERLAFGIAGARMSTKPFTPVPVFADYGSLTAENASTICNYLDFYRTASQSLSGLGTALRRYDLAIDRWTAEDRIIDLWIALEALLARGSRSELSYRASLRLAQAVGSTAIERAEIFATARDSYDMRSKIVHGQDVADSLPTVRNLGELTRRLLLTWLDPAKRPSMDELDRRALS